MKLIAALTLWLLCTFVDQCTSSPLPVVDTTRWGYDGDAVKPDKWASLPNSHCGSWKQSPINFDLSAVYWKALETPKLVENSTVPGNYTITNNGHKISLAVPLGSWTFSYPSDSSSCLSVKEMHWHWGLSSDHGSEHSLDNVFFPAEGHIVTWNCHDYPSYDVAKASPSGLAVFGIFYKLVLEDLKNDFFQKFTSLLTSDTLKTKKSWSDPDAAMNVSRLDLRQFLPTDQTKFYRYEGSLTTPDCSESVIWTVFKDPFNITEAQVGSWH